MAAGFATTLRNAMLDRITVAADAGSGASKVRVYNGTRPATGGSVGGSTLLVECTSADPFAPAASAGVLSPTLPATATVAATGTATWFRVVDSSNTFVFDGSVGAEMTINFPNLVAADPFDITSFAITAPNP